MKRNVKKIIGTFFYYFFPLLSRVRNIRIILMYHRIVDRLPDDDFFDSGMYVTAKSFENHILEIRKYFKIVSLAEMLDSNSNDCTNICAFTFDDGWYDNYEFAFPILKEHKVAASIFLPINYIGSERQYWFQVFWDAARRAAVNGVLDEFNSDLRSFLSGTLSLHTATLETTMLHLKRLPPGKLDRFMKIIQMKYGLQESIRRSTMDWDEVNEMEQNNITFGSHGINHFILTGLSSSQKWREIERSYSFLSAKLKNFLPVFCYPNGNWDDECVQYVHSAGYIGAVTTQLGTVPRNPKQMYILNRIGMHEDICTSRGLFWFRIFQALISDRKKSK